MPQLTDHGRQMVQTILFLMVVMCVCVLIAFRMGYLAGREKVCEQHQITTGVCK